MKDTGEAAINAELAAERNPGLRRIGVAVAVWAAAAWGKREGRKWPRGTSWSDGYGHAATELTVRTDAVEASWRLLAFERADMAAERERVRRWQLRLRWRKTEERDEEDLDRLLARAQILSLHNRSVRTYRWLPIAGPKPGRFLP